MNFLHAQSYIIRLTHIYGTLYAQTFVCMCGTRSAQIQIFDRKRTRSVLQRTGRQVIGLRPRQASVTHVARCQEPSIEIVFDEVPRIAY